jgi:hypothetical protein
MPPCVLPLIDVEPASLLAARPPNTFDDCDVIDMKQNARLCGKYRTPIDPIANAYADKQ